MRRSVIDPSTARPELRSDGEWLNLEQVAKVEVTSEDPSFPIDYALASENGPGWRAADKGKQIIRIISISRHRFAGLSLSFRKLKLSEPRNSLFDGRLRKAGRPQRSFASNGLLVRMARRSRSREYQVNLNNVCALELAVKPDLTPGNVIATLARWRVA